MVKGRTRKFLLGGIFAALLVGGFCRCASATELEMSIKSFLSVDFPSFIFIDASPTYQGLQTADAKLKVSTNEGGYTIIVSADGSSPTYTSLINNSENASIPTLTSNKTKLNFPTGYWGFSLDGGENYRGMTTYNDVNRLTLSSNDLGLNAVTDFTFAVKIDDTQPAGVYNNTILITAVADVNDIPDPADVQARALLGDSGHLVFLYDDKQYEIGDPYTNSYTSMVIEGVYDVPLYPNSNAFGSLPWHTNSSVNNITAIDFESSFEYFQPVSTRSWFYNFSSLKNINGIEHFNTSRVTDMSAMFYGAFCNSYEDVDGLRELSKLDVSSVVSMNNMFAYVGSYGSTNNSGNGGSQHYGQVMSIGNWDVSNVEDMSYMFYYFGSYSSGRHFFGDLSGWNTSNVRNMSNMFAYVCAYNRNNYNSDSYYDSNSGEWIYVYNSCSTVNNFDLRSWDVGNVTDMSQMFAFLNYSVRYKDKPLSINIDGWDVGNVTNAAAMFYYTEYGSSLGTFNLKAKDLTFTNLLYATNMFYGVGNLAADLSGWDVGPQANILSGDIFNTSSSRDIRIDASNWVIRNTNDKSAINSTFDGIGSTVSLDLSNWDVSGITTLSYAFSNNKNILSLDVTGWDTSAVTNMEGLFYGSRPQKIIGIESWNTSNVTNMEYAFSNMLVNSSEYATAQLQYDYSSNIYNHFGEADYSLAGWDVSNVTSMMSMFENATLSDRLLDSIKNWQPKKVETMAFMFRGDAFGKDENYGNIATTVDFSNWDVSKVESMYEMFAYAFITDGSQINLSGWNTASLTSMDRIFYDMFLDFGHFYNSNRAINIDLSGWDVSGITDMSNLFGGLRIEWCAGEPGTGSCSSYRYSAGDRHALNINLANWDTSNVVHMDYMFATRKTGGNMAVGSEGERRGASMRGFVEVVNGLTSLNTSKVETMSHMFEGFATDPAVWNYDFSNWDTSRVTDMSYMFAGIEAQDYLFDSIIEDRTNADSNISLDFSGLDTSAVTNMSHMFFDAGRNSGTFSMNLGGLNTANVQNMDRMIFGAGRNARNFSTNISGWNVSNVNSHSYFTDRLDFVQPNWP